MIIVLFEVTLKKDAIDGYLKMAKALSDELSKAEGFISAERFSSLKHEGKLLSMSIWESEEAVSKWRNQANHRSGQKTGMDSLFESYKITVASSIRQYTGDKREEAPNDSDEYFRK